MEKVTKVDEKKPYYRETVHSMHRRCNKWNYKGRGIYLLTLTTRDRLPILGELVHRDSEPYIEYSEVGRIVANEAEHIPDHYPQIRVLCKQVMPDHFHLLLFVEEPIPVPLGKVVRGYKQGTFSRLQVASTEHQQIPEEVSCARHFQCREPFWEEGFHDRILFHEGQLDAMIHYVKDNPRRLWLKRANPDLFRIRQNLCIGQSTYTALGKIFLTDYPLRALLQCSRSLTQAEIDARKAECLAQASNGTVFVTAAISEGEKQIARALREAGFPLIILLTEGFPAPDSPHYRYFKPSGVYFEACAAGQLLLLEPQPDAFERPDIVAQVTAKAGDIPHDTKRFRFLALNALAQEIAAPQPLS